MVIGSKAVVELKAFSEADEVTVFGQLDRKAADAVDRVADQMLMPRSWVVTQILREWAERRTAEIHELEQSWNGSFREELGEHFDAFTRE